jgi:hypothetical protein
LHPAAAAVRSDPHWMAAHAGRNRAGADRSRRPGSIALGRRSRPHVRSARRWVGARPSPLSDAQPPALGSWRSHDREENQAPARARHPPTAHSAPAQSPSPRSCLVEFRHLLPGSSQDALCGALKPPGTCSSLAVEELRPHSAPTLALQAEASCHRSTPLARFSSAQMSPPQSSPCLECHHPSDHVSPTDDPTQQKSLLRLVWAKLTQSFFLSIFFPATPSLMLQAKMSGRWIREWPNRTQLQETVQAF